MPVTAATFRLVAGGLVLILLFLVVAIAVLAGIGRDVPTILENLATGALTALAALLVSPHGGDEPTPVTIADEPVQVTSQPRRKPTARQRKDAGYVSTLVVVLIVVVVLVLVGVLR